MSELSMEVPGVSVAPPAAVAAAPATTGRLTALQLFVYGFPALPHAFVALPLFVVLPSFYVGHTAVTLAQMAAIAGSSRIFDAIADPIVGYLSDRTRSRLGRRKPWMLGVVLLCPLAIFYLFQPPATATASYFALWSFVLYVGFTMFEIPRQAWTAELSRDYTQRSRVEMNVALFNICGSLVFWVLPLALWHFTGTPEITGATLSGIAWLYALLLPIGLVLTVLIVPASLSPIGIDTAPRSTLRVLLQSIRRCRPLWRYLVAIGCWGLGQGAFLSSIYIFINDYLGLNAYFAPIMILYFTVQMCALPIWTRLLKRFDRHRIWAAALSLNVLVNLTVLAMPTGGAALVPLALMVAVGAFLGGPQVFLPGAVLGDVIDYDQMKSGVHKGSNFFALNTLVIKVTMALGGSAAFLLMAWSGYKVAGKNDAHADLGLIAAYLFFPALLNFAATATLWNFPIDRIRHGVIRARLERRLARAA